MGIGLFLTDVTFEAAHPVVQGCSPRPRIENIITHFRCKIWNHDWSTRREWVSVGIGWFRSNLIGYRRVSPNLIVSLCPTRATLCWPSPRFDSRILHSFGARTHPRPIYMVSTMASTMASTRMRNLHQRSKMIKQHHISWSLSSSGFKLFQIASETNPAKGIIRKGYKETTRNPSRTRVSTSTMHRSSNRQIATLTIRSMALQCKTGTTNSTCKSSTTTRTNQINKLKRL